MPDQATLKELLAKYKAGTCTEAEKALLENWIANSSFADFQLSETDMEADLAFISANLPLRKNVRRLWPRIAAAASILVILSAGVYILFKPKAVQQTAQLVKNDVAPGHNQATLTLANGQKIVLTKGLSGRIAVQNQTVISAGQNTITYKATPSEDQLVYNTLSTARGEQSPYPLVLADGTKVWLNAESSITFPTVFNQKQRIVKLTGEAYFEVKHNAAQPFEVQAANQTIEDIGTEFDVKAYGDEATATTLVEGSVKVNHTLLKPGEEFINDKVGTASLKEVLAWKDGYFRFNDAPITAIMKELARWYDIEVVYDGAVPQDHFSGKISRYRNISAVLRMLEKTKHVHFKVEGRRVTVSAKS